MIMKYYLSPKSWNSSSWRDVLTAEEIEDLPEDWEASAADCIPLGDFNSAGAAWDAAREIDPDNLNPLRPE
jgi:hypothetical protein